MSNHRRKRPRDEAFEVPDLNQVSNTPDPGFVDRITKKLRPAFIDVRTVEFLRSKSLPDEENGAEWKVWRYLGQGGFGHVAAWRQRSTEDQHLLDEIVVKQEIPIAFYGPRQLTGGASTEAWIQAKLNQENCGNIVHLRNFKLHHTVWPQYPGIWRSYLEYCPYGNLNDLRLHYKAFNRYLPELFLWHVFDSLATTAQLMHRAATFDSADIRLNGGDPGNQAKPYVLHLDIKPQNIFLGYEEMHPTTVSSGGIRDYNYPTVKLGDFGLAKLTAHEDRTNPDPIRGNGTSSFKAPEQKDEVTGYGWDWTPPIHHDTDPMTEKVNVWSIGKVMHDLYSLSCPDAYFEAIGTTRREYLANGWNALANVHQLPFRKDRLSQSTPYTYELQNLIKECLRPDPRRRISSEELKHQTSQYLRQCIHQCDHPSSNSAPDPASVRSKKLYYYGNEINDMPYNEINCDLPLPKHDFDHLERPEVNDPDDPPLELDPTRLEPGDRGDYYDSQGHLISLRNQKLYGGRVDSTHIRWGTPGFVGIDFDSEADSEADSEVEVGVNAGLEAEADTWAGSPEYAGISPNFFPTSREHTPSPTYNV